MMKLQKNVYFGQNKILYLNTMKEKVETEKVKNHELNTTERNY